MWQNSPFLLVGRSVQPVEREKFSKNIRPPADEISVMGERKADGVSVRTRRKTIYFRDSENISLALCHCQFKNLQFTASLYSDTPQVSKNDLVKGRIADLSALTAAKDLSDLEVHVIHGSLDQQKSAQPKRHLNQFSRLCTVHPCDQDKQTHRPRYV